MKKQFILLMLLMLLIIPVVSAADWDNTLTYTEEDMKVDFSNSFLLLFKTSAIGTIELKSHSSVEQVKEVGAGEQVVMYYDFDFLGLYENGLGEVIFTDQTTGEEIDRDYSFVYWGNETYDNIICVDKGATPLDCKEYGVVQVTRETWLPYNSMDIPKGNIRIGLMTYVEVNDHVDGVWTIAGKKVRRHSEWTASLNVGLVRYFKLDDQTGGVATDATGTSNGGIVGSVENITGHIGFAANSSTTGEYVYSNIGADPGVWTVGVWFNMPLPSEQNIVSVGDAEVYVLANGTVGGEQSAKFWGNQTFNANQWNLIITQVDDSDDTTIQWVNNVLSYKSTGVISPLGGTNWTFPRTGDKVVNVAYDEAFIANRTWTPAEIDQVWNGGAGITFTDQFPSPPTSTLNAPANNAVVTNPTVIFNATGVDNTDLVNMSLIINESYVSTNASVFNATLTQFPFTLVANGFWNWTVEACDSEVSCTNATSRNITLQNDLAITLNAPANTFNSTSNTIIFNGTGADDTNLVNMSFILNATYNETNSSVFNNTLTQFSKTIADGFYNWTMEVCDNLGACLNATTRNVSIDATDPLLELLSPIGNVSYSNGTTGVTTWTATDDNIDSCWWQYAEINETVTCADNVSIFNLTASRDFIFWVNDTFGNEVSNVSTFEYRILQNAVTFNSSTLETASETFYINITTNGFTPSLASLIYNSTEYSGGTITNIAGKVYNISRKIDIPTTAEAKPFFWNITVSGVEVTTQITNQTVALTNFTQFTVGVPFINISFKNETLSQQLVNATISSDWNYWLGDGGVVKTLSFTNTSLNLDYQFLLVGVNRTLNTNVSLIYNNPISQQRNFVSDFTLTNTTTEQTLFLLPTADGVFVTFQVINVAEQPLSGVFSNVSRNGNLISSGTTDDSGAIAYFLDPDVSYVFYFISDDHAPFTTTLTPTSTEYTIKLGETAADPDDDFTTGITYSIVPSTTTLTNGTLTFFNFTLASSFWAVTDYGFNLTNQDGTIVNATNESANGGTVFVLHNVSNDTSFVMSFYWVITGNTTSGNYSWVVFDSSGTGFGMTTFFNRVGTYLGEGLFGIDTNGMVILIYLIMFISAGIMSVKFGITSPGNIFLMLFGLSFLFEVHLQLIPYVRGIPLLTTILGITFVIMVMREFLIKS